MQMRRFTDSEGRPLSIRPTVLLVPPELEDTANTLMTADRFEDGKTNIYKGSCEVVVEPRLTSPTAWFLLDTSNDVKPFITRSVKRRNWSSRPTRTPTTYSRAVIQIRCRGARRRGYGFWQMAYGSTGEA
ncbi:Mu-like prophage major head subunit gpT [Edwardsiella tarda]|nr:Mu-like prophage major head subunit gpT [Edwardsiella tarda]